MIRVAIVDDHDLVREGIRALLEQDPQLQIVGETGDGQEAIKLADLTDKKRLVQSALVIYSVGSLVAGVAPTMGVLVGARALQGVGVGGLTALVQVVIATMVAPRERVQDEPSATTEDED